MDSNFTTHIRFSHAHHALRASPLSMSSRMKMREIDIEIDVEMKNEQNIEVDIKI